jgi:hypothetical protein
MITDRGLETSQARYRDHYDSTKFYAPRKHIVGTATSRLDNFDVQDDCSRLVSTLFFKQFLKRPFQIASIIPSSKALVERVASKMDFSQPRVIAEYGPGEGGVRIQICFYSSWTERSRVICNVSLPATSVCT